MSVFADVVVAAISDVVVVVAVIAAAVAVAAISDVAAVVDLVGAVVAADVAVEYDVVVVAVAVVAQNFCLSSYFSCVRSQKFGKVINTFYVCYCNTSALKLFAFCAKCKKIERRTKTRRGNYNGLSHSWQKLLIYIQFVSLLYRCPFTLIWYIFCPNSISI